MRLDTLTIELIDDQMAEVYRRKTSAERLAIAFDMWDYARQRIEAAVAWQHPDWDAGAVNREVSGSGRLLDESGDALQLPP